MNSLEKKILNFVFIIALGLVGAGVTACSPNTSHTENSDSVGGTTLIGTPLRVPGWSAETRAKLEKDLEIAEAVMRVAPEREESYIWLGRRLGYLARWDEAINVFTEGLEKFPNSYKLLRFRGRHLVRNRQMPEAIADYQAAATLVEDVTDSYEPDGIINSRHQYLGSYRSNIHYYLGQACWALGDYECTLRGMERASSEPLVQHDDRRVVTSFWRYLAFRKLGRGREAREAISGIPQNLELVENFSYYNGVLLFKGLRTADELLPEADAVVKFAIAMEYSFNGDLDLAEELWQEIVEENAQGFWPAEAELVLMQNN